MNTINKKFIKTIRICKDEKKKNEKNNHLKRKTRKYLIMG